MGKGKETGNRFDYNFHFGLSDQTSPLRLLPLLLPTPISQARIFHHKRETERVNPLLPLSVAVGGCFQQFLKSEPSVSSFSIS